MIILSMKQAGGAVAVVCGGDLSYHGQNGSLGMRMDQSINQSVGNRVAGDYGIRGQRLSVSVKTCGTI